MDLHIDSRPRPDTRSSRLVAERDHPRGKGNSAPFEQNRIVQGSVDVMDERVVVGTDLFDLPQRSSRPGAEATSPCQETALPLQLRVIRKPGMSLGSEPLRTGQTGMVQIEPDTFQKLLWRRRFRHLFDRGKRVPHEPVVRIGSEQPQSLRARRKIQEPAEPHEAWSSGNRARPSAASRWAKRTLSFSVALITRRSILLGRRGTLCLLFHFVDRLFDPSCVPRAHRVPPSRTSLHHRTPRGTYLGSSGTTPHPQLPSCFGSTSDGASVIRSVAEAVFGKAITSRR